MSASYTEWQFQLFNTRTRKPIDDDSGVCNVLTADSPVELTIYSDAAGTSGSNPLTFTNGIVRFYTASSITTADLSLLTDQGHSCFVENATPSMHRIDIDPERIFQELIIPYIVVGASEAVVDTGFDIGAGMLVKDMWLHTTTLGTGAVIDIGTSTDTDGFLDGVTVDATGFLAATLQETPTSAHQIGALIASTTGANVRKLHKRANATSGANIIYINTTSSSTAGSGYIYLEYRRVPTGA